MSQNTKVILLIVAAAFAGMIGLSVGGAAGASMGYTGLWLPVLLLVLFVAYILWNLKGTKNATSMSAADKQAALTFTPPTDTAALYLVRTGFLGKAVGLTVTVDGQPVVQLKSPRFTRIELSPGQRVISGSFSGGAGAQNSPAEMVLNVTARQVVVLHFVAEMGMLKNAVKIEEWPVREASQKLPGITAIQANMARV